LEHNLFQKEAPKSKSNSRFKKTPHNKKLEWEDEFPPAVKEVAKAESPSKPTKVSPRKEDQENEFAPAAAANFLPRQPLQNLDPNLPWYLQVQPAKHSSALDADHPLAARQKLPDLPPDPPSILSQLLQHLSVDIGLDSLSILDLRAISPPPALGANLLMVLGTARSEKHLHVSADRFCRFLRSEYKMRPFADGLLGRNEFKLKMRRKNRRAKLLANAGVVSAEDVDDGIRTGWVCVHVGLVEPAEGVREKDEVKSASRTGFVGFGSEESRVTIVVQMLTEEKRKEVDLEGLWTELLERNLRKQKYRDEDAAAVKAEAEAVGAKEAIAQPDEEGLKQSSRSDLNVVGSQAAWSGNQTQETAAHAS
jgi:hypothetical protein